ncbi:hypothetical protein [Sphingomonas oligophenolica]|uniref:hypothetical protein n=1 Tax=Sphingomonas oligophenolica TaxID=301154 RepID=UPI0031E32059
MADEIGGEIDPRTEQAFGDDQVEFLRHALEIGRFDPAIVAQAERDCLDKAERDRLAAGNRSRRRGREGGVGRDALRPCMRHQDRLE